MRDYPSNFRGPMTRSNMPLVRHFEGEGREWVNVSPHLVGEILCAHGA